MTRMSNKREAVDWFTDGLRQRGVEWVASLCGHGQDPLFDSFRRSGIRIVDVRNEQTAGYIAEGYGRLTRRPGVCTSSSGVAVANALTGVMNAWFDHAPMLFVSGSANSDTLGMGCFQDSPHTAMSAPLTRYSRRIEHPARAVQILDEAWRAALGCPHGPVHIDFPMDMQKAVVAEEDLVLPAPSAPPPGPNAGHIGQVAAALRQSSRPLIIAGTETYYAGESGDLMAFAEAFSIPVQTPIWDRGVCDDPSDAFTGIMGAFSGNAGIFHSSDCLIVSAPADYRLGYLRTTARTIPMGRGWRLLHERMVDTGALPYRAWLAEARGMQMAFRNAVLETGARQRMDGRIHAVDLVGALDQVLPANGVLVIDGGSIGQWAHHLLTRNRYPAHWLTCGRSGVVGYGLGGAMAARLAYPDRAVVLLSGDGAFTFTAAEIECAVRQKLPFVAVVADDQCWGITHSGHLRQFGEGIGTVLGPVRFDRLAESLGARGRRVDRAEDIAPAVDAAIASGEVTVIHVPISGGNPA